jgi:hypothetical protein
MSRQVVTAEDFRDFSAGKASSAGMGGGAATAPALDKGKHAKLDTYQQRLLKYTPTEAVALFLFLDGVLRAAPENVPAQMLRWVVFLALMVGTWLYLERLEKVTKRKQLVISTVAFAIWALAIGGPFGQYDWYSPIYGAVLLPLYTLGVPLIGSPTESNS